MSAPGGAIAENVLIFAPLPPLPSPVARHCFDLLGGLARQRHCTVVTEDEWSGPALPRGVRHLALSEYHRCATDFAHATHLYHLAAHPDHLYMLPVLTTVPGVVVLHDPSLHALLEAATIAHGDGEGYATALANDYAGPGRSLAEHYRRDGWLDPAARQDMRMLAGVVGPSRGVIVESNYAAAKVLADVPDAPVSAIPRLYLTPAATDAPQARDSLGIGADELLLVSLGAVTADKCLDLVLRALAGIAAALPPFRYVIAGEIGPTAPDLPALATRLGLGARVMITGTLPASRRNALLAAADIVINLRDPSHERISNNAIDALGAGACTLLIDGGPLAEWPDDVAEKLAWGPGLQRRLGATLLRLAGDPASRRRIGRAAASMIAGRHGLDQVIPRYLRAIDAAGVRPRKTWCTPITWAFAPPSAPRPATGPLWQRNLALPLRTEPFQAIRYGTGTDREWPSDLAEAGAPREADLVLVDVAADALVLHTNTKLRRLNRMLRFGGLLIINITRTEDGARGGLESYGEGTKLLEAAGFSLDRHITAAEPDLREPEEIPIVEERCWVVTKRREFFTAANWLWDE